MDFLHRICDWLEYLGGQRDSVPQGFLPRRGWLVRGLWWGLMAVLIAIFCGQGSKFLYIDF